MEEEYYTYTRMFKGEPKGVTLNICSDFMSEAEMFFNTEFRNHIPETEDAIEKYDRAKDDPDANEEEKTVEVSFDNESLKFAEDVVAVSHIQGSEESLVRFNLFKSIAKDMKEKIEAYEDKEAPHHGIRYMKDILKDTYDRVSDTEDEKISYPVIREENGEYKAAIFIAEADRDKKVLKHPDRWCLVDLETGSLLDIKTYPEDELGKEYHIESREEYSESYMDSLLDLFDAVRYELLEDREFNWKLYRDYLDSLLKEVPEELVPLFEELDASCEEVPEEPEKDSDGSEEDTDDLFFIPQGEEPPKEDSEEKPEDGTVEEFEEDPEEESENSEEISKEDAKEEPEEEADKDESFKTTFEEAMKDDEEDQGGFFSFFKKK